MLMTQIFTSNHVLLNAKNDLEKVLTLIIDYYEMHCLALNASKTECVIFCKKSGALYTTDIKLKIGNCCIRKSKSIKYLGVSIDSALLYQDEVKSILPKMACCIKTLYYLREVISDNYKVLTLNALVISHLHYSAVLLNGVNNSLIRSLEKQLSWGVKACFHRKKYDSSLDLKIKNKILPIRHFLDQKSFFHFWKIVSEKLPAYQMIEYPTLKLTKHERSKKFFFNIKTQSSYLENCVFK